jgi:hypothetical protein
MSDDHPTATGREQEIAPRDIDPAGSARGVDDHAITPHATGTRGQPANGADAGVDVEHLRSPSQGARPEEAPDPERDAPPEGSGGIAP